MFVQKQGAMNAPFNVGQPPVNPQPVTPEIPKDNVLSVPKDWKTYRNLKMKFEIKYPPDWKVDEQVNVVNGNIGAVIIYKGEKKVTIPGSPISPYSNDIGISILERGKTCGDCNIALSQNLLTEIFVNKYYVLAFKNNDALNSTLWIYSPLKDNVLRLDYGAQEKNPQIDKIFQTILSTFKFLE